MMEGCADRAPPLEVEEEKEEEEKEEEEEEERRRRRRRHEEQRSFSLQKPFFSNVPIKKW